MRGWWCDFGVETVNLTFVDNLTTWWTSDPKSVPSRPLPSEEGTTSKVLRTLTWKTRPEYGLGCLICSKFARQRPARFEGGAVLLLLLYYSQA